MSGGVLAIDLGAKKSGFASADGLRLSTQVLEPLRAAPMDSAFVAHVDAFLAERDVQVLLLGLPLDIDGRESKQTAYVHKAAAGLRERYPALEVVLYDERFTSKAAEELVREAGVKAKDRKTLRDSFAALVLLRDWIESGEPRP